MRAVPEKAQSGQSALHCGGPCPEPAFDADRIAGERQPGGSDAGRLVRPGLVDDQSIGGVRLVNEIVERFALQRLKFRIVDRLPGAHDLT